MLVRFRHALRELHVFVLEVGAQAESAAGAPLAGGAMTSRRQRRLAMDTIAHRFAQAAALVELRHCGYTSVAFFSGRLRTGLPVAAWIAFSTAGATTQMVGSPTPPQKSNVGTMTV